MSWDRKILNPAQKRETRSKFSHKKRNLAKFPSISAGHAVDKGGHRFVGRARLQLRISALLGLTLAAGEHVRFGPLVLRHLVVIYRLLGELFAQFGELLGGHLFRLHRGESFRRDDSLHQRGAQLRIFRVFQVRVARANFVFVFWINSRAVQFINRLWTFF